MSLNNLSLCNSRIVFLTGILGIPIIGLTTYTGAIFRSVDESSFIVKKFVIFLTDTILPVNELLSS